jgi:hypothetical protein
MNVFYYSIYGISFVLNLDHLMRSARLKWSKVPNVILNDIDNIGDFSLKLFIFYKPTFNIKKHFHFVKLNPAW